MELNYKYVLAACVVALGCGYLAGYSNRKTVTTVQEKIIEKVVTVEVDTSVKAKETSKAEKSTKTKETIKQKDGTVITRETDSKETLDISKEVDLRVKEKLAQIEKEQNKNKTVVVTTPKRVHISVQAGLESEGLGFDSLTKKSIYGAQLEYNLFSAIYVGGWGNSKKDFGVSVGIDL